MNDNFGKTMNRHFLQYYNKYLVGKDIITQRDQYTISGVDPTTSDRAFLSVMAFSKTNGCYTRWNLCVDKDTQQNALNDVPALLSIEVNEVANISAMIVVHSSTCGEKVLEEI